MHSVSSGTGKLDETDAIALVSLTHILLTVEAMAVMWFGSSGAVAEFGTCDGPRTQ